MREFERLLVVREFLEYVRVHGADSHYLREVRVIEYRTDWRGRQREVERHYPGWEVGEVQRGNSIDPYFVSFELLRDGRAIAQQRDVASWEEFANSEPDFPRAPDFPPYEEWRVPWGEGTLENLFSRYLFGLRAHRH